MESLLVEEIKDAMREERGEGDKRTYVYVSELGSPCDVQIWYGLVGAQPNDLDAQTALKFEQGSEVHRNMMSALFQSREIEVITSESDIMNSDVVHGRVDCIFSRRGDDKMQLVDFKSSSGRAWEYIPQDSHITQVQAYLYFLENIEKGWLLYYNKETQELDEYEVERNDEKIEELVERAERLIEMAMNDEKPEEPNKNKWDFYACKYCKYSGVCNY